jgi:hypothetical protein
MPVINLSTLGLQLVDTTSGSGSLVLPETTFIVGKGIIFKDQAYNFDKSSLTIKTSGNDIFENGTSSLVLDSKGQSLSLIADASGVWYDINRSDGKFFAVSTNTLTAASINTYPFPGNNVTYLQANTSQQHSYTTTDRNQVVLISTYGNKTTPPVIYLDPQKFNDGQMLYIKNLYGGSVCNISSINSDIENLNINTLELGTGEAVQLTYHDKKWYPMNLQPPSPVISKIYDIESFDEYEEAKQVLLSNPNTILRTSSSRHYFFVLPNSPFESHTFVIQHTSFNKISVNNPITLEKIVEICQEKITIVKKGQVYTPIYG